MKNHSVVKDTGRTRPPTRAERRARERAEKHQRAKRQGNFATRIGIGNLVGGALTLVAVLVLVIYGIGKSNAGNTSSAGLTDAGALNPASPVLQVGQRAPNFTLHTANGTAYHLAAQRGHPVLLEFFAVWCPVCQSEAPIMAKLTREYAPKGVRVWSVLANPYGKNYEVSGRTNLSLATRDDLSWYASNFSVRHPQLIDPTFGTVNRYGISAYPGIYVVNGKGLISFAGVGHQGYSKLSTALDKALAGMKSSEGR